MQETGKPVRRRVNATEVSFGKRYLKISSEEPSEGARLAQVDGVQRGESHRRQTIVAKRTILRAWIGGKGREKAGRRGTGWRGRLPLDILPKSGKTRIADGLRSGGRFGARHWTARVRNKENGAAKGESAGYLGRVA